MHLCRLESMGARRNFRKGRQGNVKKATQYPEGQKWLSTWRKMAP